MFDSILVHTDEITLKGANRAFFERALTENLRRQLAGVAELKMRVRKGLVLLWAERDLSAEREKIRAALRRTFGVSTYLLARRLPAEMGALEAAVPELVAGWSGTFRATVRRADKNFSLTSVETARQVGGAALKSNPELKVDLTAPERTIYVEINHDGLFLSGERVDGPGGLPTGTTGTMVVLLSGGIDSPVAAWKLLRRGCRVIFVHCHSYPHVGRESIDKVRRLAKVLDGFQGGSVIYTVPIAAAQREIVAKAAEAPRVLLYRRLMLRLAERIARRENALGLVTGDSLGQVASQTPENLLAVSAAAGLPIYRPLIGDDKRDITALSRTIGTYGISIEPHDDCCSVFVPDHPELRATPERLAAEESKLDYEELLRTALDTAERETF
ncbi:MAG: tRNA uracil 4-sulfurtransferase ThiI [bacterium]